MAGTGAFVGREGELSRLESALGDRAPLVLVVGDAGIGKTRFVAEGLARATHVGMLTIGGSCLPLSAKLPLLPIADALSELTRLGGGAPFEAALEVAPAYVRSEVARLLPKLAAGEPATAEPVEAWRHERLFAGVAELLDGVARRSALAFLIEDVHWADGATLDLLTYLSRSGRAGPVTVVVTCRSDEVPLDAAVGDWPTHIRRDAEVEEIRLGPLSQEEVAKQVTALVGAAPSGELVAEVYARAEGHPFFTEQLVAAAVPAQSGLLAQPAVLPARLAELLVARASSCGDAGQAVLAALAVAGRPLSEGSLGEITGLEPDAVRTAMHELTAARLLAPPADGGHAPRHALLAEALAAELLPGERVSLHERIAGALQAAGDDALAAEAAGHWAAASRSGEELQARLTAARAAEQVFAYADAATHWQRAIELYEAEADADLGSGLDLPHLYIRAVDALEVSGDTVRAGAVAEQAYRRFADHPDRATAAAIHVRAGNLRGLFGPPPAGLTLMKEALRLFEGTAPSAEHAQAWEGYVGLLWFRDGGRPEEVLAAATRGLEVAEAAGAAMQKTHLLAVLADLSFVRGEVEEGFRLLAHARGEPGASRALTLAITEANALLKMGKLEQATRVGLRDLEDARKLGFGDSYPTDLLIGNVVEGLLHRGRTAEAAALIDPVTGGGVDREHWLPHVYRAEIDLLRGEVDQAAQRLEQIKFDYIVWWDLELGERVAEVALWAGRPDRALTEVQQLLERLADTDSVIFYGWLLTLGMRVCADQAEQARAHRDDNAVQAALAAADDLASWVKRERHVPFTEHPFVASIPAARATWDAERSRAAGTSIPEAWHVAAERWKALDYRHRAGYARWRQAEALLGTPQGGRAVAAPVLSTAADLAVQHVPLRTAIQHLARRARIDLSAPAEPVQDKPASAYAFGLTDRELDVLRLLGQGKTNPEIAAALFISPRTAGVHVTHILRKLDATTRVQAATIAERAGLLASASEPTRPRAT
jgi:DNA-binding CsgD family transcriptional regulator/tetratricopeptide (TPR) repeat protein